MKEAVVDGSPVFAISSERVHPDMTATDLLLAKEVAASYKKLRKTSKPSEYEFDKTRPRPELTHSRKPDKGIKSLIQQSRDNENKLYSTLNVRF
jgi:hypothetical protein